MDKIEELKKICQLVRYDILTSTTKAGSGHPSSSLSAVELMVTLFFGGFINESDRIIFSKGHASPLLYSLYHAAGLISLNELLTLRTFNSRLEGHPTPRFSYVDVATGSLGQGLSIGLGMALGIKLKSKIINPKSQINSKLKNINFKPLDLKNLNLFGASDLEFSASKQKPKVFVLLGDSEMTEGQIWEAMQIASYYKLNNLIAILDVNRLGQRGQTIHGWNLENYAKKAESFGWNPIMIDDGHDLKKIIEVFQSPITNHQPLMIIAKTIKGKGVSFLEDKENWHGKILNKEQLDQALKELGEIDLNIKGKTNLSNNKLQITNNNSSSNNKFQNNNLESRIYDLGSNYSTRQAYGDALESLGETNGNVVVLDAETSNSTYADKFAKKFPDRFFEMFIAEQNMISTALGISKQGFIPFISTFAAFLTRAFDQIRMSQYSDSKTVEDRISRVDMDGRKLMMEKNQSSNINLQTPPSSLHHLPSNLKFCGSHAGVSIGADGPSQMGLEDIAMFRSILESTIFYPSDAISTFKLTEIMAQNQGLFYLRTTREKLPIIYKPDEEFKIGGSKILKQSEKSKVLVIAAGITVHEALKAYDQLTKEGIQITILDLYSIKPIDINTIKSLITSHQSPITNIIVVEDHYPSGGIGEAVLSAINQPLTTNHQSLNFIHLCVKKIPRSGTMEELLAYEEIDSNAIIKAVKNLLL